MTGTTARLVVLQLLTVPLGGAVIQFALLPLVHVTAYADRVTMLVLWLVLQCLFTPFMCWALWRG